MTTPTASMGNTRTHAFHPFRRMSHHTSSCVQCTLRLLEAAARIQRALAVEISSAAQDGAQPITGNDACLARFSKCVAALRASAFERYRQHLHRYLSAQAKEQLTQRAILDTVEKMYSETLDQLGGLPFDTAAVGVQRGRSDLTLSLLESFDGFNMSLLEEVVQFNRGSCAISNFPDEHDPAKDYTETISRDLAAAWREFAINVNNILLGKGNISIPLPASAST